MGSQPDGQFHGGRTDDVKEDAMRKYVFTSRTAKSPSLQSSLTQWARSARLKSDYCAIPGGDRSDERVGPSSPPWGMAAAVATPPWWARPALMTFTAPLSPFARWHRTDNRTIQQPPKTFTLCWVGRLGFRPLEWQSRMEGEAYNRQLVCDFGQRFENLHVFYAELAMETKLLTCLKTTHTGCNVTHTNYSFITT